MSAWSKQATSCTAKVDNCGDDPDTSVANAFPQGYTRQSRGTQARFAPPDAMQLEACLKYSYLQNAHLLLRDALTSFDPAAQS